MADGSIPAGRSATGRIAADRDGASQDGTSHDVASRSAASPSVATNDAASHDGASRSAATHDAASRSAGTHDAASRSAATHDAASRSTGTHDAASRSAATHDAASHDGASRSAGTDGGASRSAATHEAASHDAAGRSAGTDDVAAHDAARDDPASHDATSRDAASPDAATSGAAAGGPGRARAGANGLALAAIALWATLASLGVALAHVPPFLLTGIALVIGSVPAWPLVARWRVPPATLALGVYGLFGFHLLLFLALRHAPPLEANLVNYLWPLFIVVLAPLMLKGMPLTRAHAGAAMVGCFGAMLAIAGGRSLAGGFAWGYLPALGSAVIWATYSLGTQRVAPFPTAAVGLFALVSGILSLACHWLLEPAATLDGGDWLLLAATGLGPLGAAFYLWDAALKRGDARQIGTLAYATPLLSTLLLAATTGLALGPWTAIGGLLVVGAAVVGVRAR